MIQVASLLNLFQDQQTYAWELLQCEVHIQTNPKVDGRDIAKLLSLYMRGVQRLNSLQDNRQSFFKNKMTSLMLKPNVMKSLSNAPKLKQQTPIKIPPPTLVSPEKKKQTSQQTTPLKPLPKQEQPPPVYQDLIKKKKEMQMHISYSTQEHTTQSLNKLITQHHQKASTLNTKIQEIIQENQKKVEQKIRMRKLKSLSARSKSQRNLEQPKQSRLRMMESIQVIKQQNEQIPKKLQNRSRKYSLQVLKTYLLQQQLISKQKKRKQTFDYQPIVNGIDSYEI